MESLCCVDITQAVDTISGVRGPYEAHAGYCQHGPVTKLASLPGGGKCWRLCAWLPTSGCTQLLTL